MSPTFTGDFSMPTECNDCGAECSAHFFTCSVGEHRAPFCPTCFAAHRCRTEHAAECAKEHKVEA